MTCGLYKIINIETNQFYIGSSVNIERRWNIHRSSLKHNKHHSDYLQRAYNLHGSEKFEYKIILICSVQDLHFFEQKILDCDIQSYNVSKEASGGDLISNHPDRDSIILKRTESQNEALKLMSQEEKNLKFGHKLELNGMFGRHRTREEKFIYHISNIGNSYATGNRSEYFKKKCSEIASKRTGSKNPFFGKNHSDYTKKRLSEIQKQRNYLPNNALAVEIDGVRYVSAKKAAIKLKISTATVLNRIRSGKFPEYKFVNTKCLETIPNGSSDDAKREATQIPELVI